MKYHLYLFAFFSFVLFFGSKSASAGDWNPDRVYFSLASYHADIDPAKFGRAEWNEVNPGLFLSWEDRYLGLNYSLGGFVNSYEDFSTYIGASYFWPIAKETELGPFIGIADYGDNSRFFDTRIGKSKFVVIGGLQLNYKNTFIQFQPVPTSDGGLGGVFAVGLNFRLKGVGN